MDARTKASAIVDRTASAARAVRANRRAPPLDRLAPASVAAAASAVADARTAASATAAQTASAVRAVRARRPRPPAVVSVAAAASAAADARTVASATVAQTVRVVRAVRAKRRRPALAARNKSSIAFGCLERSQDVVRCRPVVSCNVRLIESSVGWPAWQVPALSKGARPQSPDSQPAQIRQLH